MAWLLAVQGRVGGAAYRRLASAPDRWRQRSIGNVAIDNADTRNNHIETRPVAGRERVNIATRPRAAIRGIGVNG